MGASNYVFDEEQSPNCKKSKRERKRERRHLNTFILQCIMAFLTHKWIWSEVLVLGEHFYWNAL